MGPEDDRRREIRQLLIEQGTASTSQLAHALQLDPDRVSGALERMEEVESMGGSRDGELWHLRPSGNQNLDAKSVNRFMKGISP